MKDEFSTGMRELAAALPTRAAACRNEEQTKQSLIQPVLMMLGYDIFNPTEVVMEYAADAPVLKSRSGKPESVDYALCLDGRIVLLIEAKTTGENLDRHGGQLARYFMATECRHAILTNGLEWRFYSDLDRDNVMDENPYRIMDMRELTDDDIAFIAGFAKAAFSEEDLRNGAERVMYAAKISDYIKANIIDDMSDEIVKVILGNVYDGIRSATVVERFRPMIANEFDKCVAEKYAVKSSLVRKRDEAISKDDTRQPQPTEDATTAAAGEAEEMPSAPSKEDRDECGRRDDLADANWPLEVSYVSSERAAAPFAANALVARDGKTTLLAGSCVSAIESPSLIGQTLDIRARELAGLEEHDNHYVIDHDIEFTSTSGAAAFVRGCAANGNILWRTADGRRLGEVKAAMEDSRP